MIREMMCAGTGVALTCLCTISFAQVQNGSKGQPVLSSISPGQDASKNRSEDSITPATNEGLLAFISKNTTYPADARENGYQGTSIVGFTILSTGFITDVKIRKSSGFASLDREAVRVVRLMEQKPCWKPGTRDGKAVDSFIELPIVFSLGPSRFKRR